jgi:hypothetical protein
MSIQQIIEILVKAKADTKADKEESRQANYDLLARMDHQTKDLLSHINPSTQNLHTEQTNVIQKKNR